MDEQFAIDVISGRRRGVLPTALRTVCHVASFGYGAAMTVRNAGYVHGWFKTHRVNVPVISIGNLTTGGTGKTPLVAWFAQRLQDAGYHPGMLSRGYRSLDGATNDEAMVLARLCPNVPQVAMRDRVAGAAIAINQRGCDALVLDDAFQHRRLARDLDVVLIDALQPWGYRHLLPRGLLREPLSALKRADVVIITRADQVDVATIADIRHTVARIRGVNEHIAVQFAPQRLINALGEIVPLRSPVAPRQESRLIENAECLTAFLSRSDRATNSIAFCGIGNPDGFRRTLHDLGVNGELRVFPDHHRYTTADLDDLARWQRESGAAALITTMKDLVKIPADHPLAPDIWAVEIAPEFLAGEDHLQRRLQTVLPIRVPQRAVA